jgi:hypothetical protein
VCENVRVGTIMIGFYFALSYKKLVVQSYRIIIRMISHMKVYHMVVIEEYCQQILQIYAY